MLSGYKILDLSRGSAAMCGQILAGLGASVDILHRSQDEAPGRGAYDRGKRTLAGTLEDAIANLGGYDLVIECDGELEYESVRTAHPNLIVVSISPFGLQGPKANFKASDLIVLAASGVLSVNGDPSREPIRMSLPQAFANAGADAAVAAMLALRLGRGQHVDISAQQAMTFALTSRSLDGFVGNDPVQRRGEYIELFGARIRTKFECADGHVVAMAPLGATVAAFGVRLSKWAVELCDADSAWLEFDWAGALLKLQTGVLDSSVFDQYNAMLSRLFARFTKAELMHEAVNRRLLVAPIFTVAEAVRSEHFSARRFALPANGKGLVPGPFAKFGRSHLDEKTACRPRRVDQNSRPLLGAAFPLSDVKILDFSWVLAGPTAVETLADFGAHVIRIESRRSFDTYRVTQPFAGGIPDPNNSLGFFGANANKQVVTVDVNHDAGRTIVHDLIRWADVIVESFSPGAIDRMGYGYSDAVAINPKIIMLSSSLLGRDGPWSKYAGFGDLATAICGFHHVMGYRGEAPRACSGPYTDFLASRFNCLAVLGALIHRDRTGEGQYVDLSQAEASIQFLSPELLRETQTETDAARIGNDDPNAFPHGVYRSCEPQRWIAIAIVTDEMWISLVDLLGDSALDRMWTMPERLSHRSVIEERIAAYAGLRDVWTMQSEMQKVGVAAHHVATTADLFADPQLVAREHFVTVLHPQWGEVAIEGQRIKMSDSPAKKPTSAPVLGRDTDQVLSDVLSYSALKIAELHQSGALN